MIQGVTCGHCSKREGCLEADIHGMICRAFSEDWEAIEADPSTKRQWKAEKKRMLRRIRREIEELNAECKIKSGSGETSGSDPAADTSGKD